MRDRISRALVRVLELFPLTRRKRPGRHSPAHFAARTKFTPPVICTASTPVPPHVLARTAPLLREPRVPPYLRDWIRDQEAEWERQRQRRVSAVAAVLGQDVPFAPDRTVAARLGVPA
ncbi:hypothetical protein ACIBCM_13725 [Streptomyces sp. NPDC051018]|uniref:hypothetical protein n=1 Tax=Streptomyces sp. NPDC051018 TaxID=3365639 RepID=UPI0037A31F9C